MDRRAAGALLALAACIACSAAAPTASNHTALDLYEGSPEGCYYNFQHYGEGDRIMTNEPCLNCTCHNRMLMCYLRVCPFTKPIGQDCTVEKRADQCCPIVTCPDVPVDLLTSTSTSSPAEYGATGLGKLDKYGCSISGKYFPEGSKVPPTPNKPCEHCYCIRNMTTCVMQECTLHVDGCTPIYHKDVCCPVRYSCDHPEDEMPLLDDMSTTVRPTPGFLLTTTTLSPVTQMSQDCVHNDQIIADGASITTEKACEHCYCMKGDIVCVVQECGAPMENEGKNCTSLPPREGQCCPDTYICEGDEASSEIPLEATTDSILEKLTIVPPRRTGVEGSGYRHEPNEAAYTEVPTGEPEVEGSGEEQEFTPGVDISGKPEDIIPTVEDGDQYTLVTTTTASSEKSETATKEIDENVISDDNLEKETVLPQSYDQTTFMSVEKDVPASTSAPTVSVENQDTTESNESMNTVPDIVPDIDSEKDHDEKHEYAPTSVPTVDGSETSIPQESEETKDSSTDDKNISFTPTTESTSEPEYLTPKVDVPEIETKTTEKSYENAEQITERESTKPEIDISGTTSVPAVEETDMLASERPETGTVSDKYDDEVNKDHYEPSTTSTPLEEMEKLTTEPNHAQNTVDVAEGESSYPHLPSSEEAERTTASDLGPMVTEKVFEPEEHISTRVPALGESDSTAEPDKGLNTIPSETDEESSSQPPLVDRTTSSVEIKTTGTPSIVDTTEAQEVDIKIQTASETSTLLPETHATKIDQYTITTEPSFRKEDEAIASTEKTKAEAGPTTIKAEFVDEGLIPTSSHDDKLSTSSDVLSVEDEMTTIIPEYNKEFDETVISEQPTTESIPAISGDSLASPEKPSETPEPEDELTPSTEKIADIPALVPHDNVSEEPSRIPGEGDCLLNGVTYRNNSIVPSSNNCHTGCKCVSSIVKCDPIICSPPPDYMDNCQSIYDTPDSCCPTYVCDHPRETMPPQSDNQMSGTEPPLPRPTIECRGDQCDLIEPTKSTEVCVSGNCSPAANNKTGTNECEGDGCSIIEKPTSSQPSSEHPECADGKCEPAHTLPHSEQAPMKPCEGSDCKDISGEKIPQLCENGENCKKTEVDDIQSGTNGQCGSNGCDSNVSLPPHDSQIMPCTEKDGCKPQEITPSDCTGDEPCRRKDSPATEQLPGKCEGTDCEQNSDVTVMQDIHSISTELPATEQISLETNGPAESEKPSDSTDRQILEAEMITSTPSTQFIEQKPTEQSIDEITETIIEKEPQTAKPLEETGATESDTVHEDHYTKPALEDKATTTADVTGGDHTDKTPLIEEPETTSLGESDKKHTDEVVPVEVETTKVPEQPEEYTDKTPLVKEHETTDDDVDKKTTDKVHPTEEEYTRVTDKFEEYTDKTTEIPDLPKEHTDKPSLAEDSSTNIADDTEKADINTKMPDGTEEHTIKPISDEDETSTKIHDVSGDHSEEPVTVKEEDTKTTSVGSVETTDRSSSTEKQESDIPDTTDKIHQNKQTTTEEEGVMLGVTQEFTEKSTKMPEELIAIEEPSTKTPAILEEYTDEPITTEDEETRTTDNIEEHSNKPPMVIDQQVPVVAKEGSTDKLPSDKEDSSGILDVTEEYNDKQTEIPDIVKEYTNSPPSVDTTSMKQPENVEEYTYKPISSMEEDAKTTENVAEHTAKPLSVEEQSLNIADETNKEPTEKIIPGKADGPNLIEETSVKPTEIPDEEKLNTERTITATEEDLQSPDVISEDHTDKSTLVEEQDTKTPDIVTDKTLLDHQTEKPATVEDESEIPTTMKETSDEKPTEIEKEGTTESTITEEDGTESSEGVNDSTKKPIIIDDGMPDELSSSTEESPIAPEEAITGDPIVIDEKPSEKPSAIDENTKSSASVEKDPTTPSIEEEHKDKPEIIEVSTRTPEVATSEQEHIPQTPDEEGSGTEAPEADKTETDTENKQPETSTEENVTQEPEGGLYTESHLETVDIITPEVNTVQETVTSKYPDDESSPVSVTDSHAGSDIVTPSEISVKQEETTNTPLATTVSMDTLPPSQEHVTSSHESMPDEHELTKTPELIVITEPAEKITKSPDHDTETEQGQLFTDIPKLESSVTEMSLPETGLTGLPDLSIPVSVNEESTINVIEKDTKPNLPESHVKDDKTGYEGTSVEPEHEKATIIPEDMNLDTHEINELDVKTAQPDVFTPEKEEMIPSTAAAADTSSELPVKGFTEIEDSFVTGEEETTEQYEDTTERLEPFVTENISSSSETLSSDSASSSESDTEITKRPEIENTESHEIYTEAPAVKVTKSSESFDSNKSEMSTTLSLEAFATSRTPESSQETTEADVSVSVEPHRRTETTESDEGRPDTKPVAPESPVSVVTESVTYQDEKTTANSERTESEITTVPSITGSGSPAAEDSETIATATNEEQPKTTESSIMEPHITEAYETDLKEPEKSEQDISRATDLPEIPTKPETTQTETALPIEHDMQKSSTEYPATSVEIHTALPHAQATTQESMSLVTESQPDIGLATEKHDYTEEEVTERADVLTSSVEATTAKQIEDVSKLDVQTPAKAEYSETTPYLIVELEEHTHKMGDDISTLSPVDEIGDVFSTPSPSKYDDSQKDENLSTVSPAVEDDSHKMVDDTSTVFSAMGEATTAPTENEIRDSEILPVMKPEDESETATKLAETPSDKIDETSTVSGAVSSQTTSPVPEEATESLPEATPTSKLVYEETTKASPVAQNEDNTTPKSTQDLEEATPAILMDTEKPLSSQSDIAVATEKEPTATEKPSPTNIDDVAHDKITVPEDELIFTTTKATTLKQEDLLTPPSEDKYSKPEEKPTSEVLPSSPTAEVPKPPVEAEPTEEIPAPEDDGHFPPSVSGYGEPDYTEEDQAFGPGTCRYGGKVYVSAQQIPRDDPCDFCFCFRSDIICLQQSCPPPIHGCHEEPIQGFCCPRYECPVSMATTVNVTTTTTTTTTTLPPHFPTHSYKGAAQRRGCQIKGHTYKVGEVVRSSSGPCLHCTCGGDGQMKCDPKACTPEPMLRQMIAAAVSAKRRR